MSWRRGGDRPATAEQLEQRFTEHLRRIERDIADIKAGIEAHQDHLAELGDRITKVTEAVKQAPADVASQLAAASARKSGSRRPSS